MGGAWYEVVGGIGAGVGGLAAATGAGAAWRAASASRETSQNAADALALALKPHLRVETFAVGEPEATAHGVWTARVLNESAFVALDIVLEARFRDGVRARQEIERMAPGAFEAFTLREIAAPPGGPSASRQGESLLLRYSDERRLARYETGFAFLQRQSDGTPTGGVMPDGEPRRIVGP
jgi:hypothetical protein